MKANTIVFSINQIEGVNGKILIPKNGNQPPPNRSTHKTDKKNILPYSPRKNKAKVILEYSVLNPATNSDSDSGRSNGARFVSANIAIKNTIASGNKGKLYHSIVCPLTISFNLNLPLAKMAAKIIVPKKISYEII